MLRAMQEGLPDPSEGQILSDEKLAMALNALKRVDPNHHKEAADVQAVLLAHDRALRLRVDQAEAALSEDPARRFGLLALAAWWNEGQPGDLEGDVLQGYADRAGLWHHVDRHAAGVECEWCGNDGSGCGELTDAGERAWAEAESMPVRSVPSRIDELTVLLRECNAVCLCGCPDSEHEADECGEDCGRDNHECIRVPKAVLAYVERLRSTPPPPSDAVREAAEIVRTILTAHDARLSESGGLTYGPPSKGTGFVAAIQWLRRYDAARGGE